MCCSEHILSLIVKEWLTIIKEGVEKIQESVAYWITTPKKDGKI